MRETWGSLIRSAREEELLTQEQAAHMCGVGVRTWKRWEADGCVPRIPETQMVVAVLGLDPKEAGEARRATAQAGEGAGLSRTATTSGG